MKHHPLSIQKKISGNLEEICNRLTEALKTVDFGILTRIDFDRKIQEKLNEEIERCVILGACNPKLALEAYRQSTDVALLIPCNIVIREVSREEFVIEAMRPTKMLDFVKDVRRSDSIEKAERDLEKVILDL